MRSEFTGTIIDTRAVEDCIRATKKYTKGVFKKEAQHPIQGEDFPSKVITEYYEIYPEMEVDWEMPASNWWMWVWGDTPHIDVRFFYNYNSNKGKMIVYGNNGVVDMLKEGIPGLTEALLNLQSENEKIYKKAKTS